MFFQDQFSEPKSNDNVVNMLANDTLEKEMIVEDEEREFLELLEQEYNELSEEELEW